ncbi:MAG: hypothetical protein ACE5F1_07790, partial [Planctomycetota bacterium]
PKSRADCRRWFVFGRLKGHLRRGDTTGISELSENEGLLVDLIADPAITAQILPYLMGNYFHEGNFEKAVWVLRLMEARLGVADGTVHDQELLILIDAALSDLLARVERGKITPEQEGSLRRALRRAMEIDRFDNLSQQEKARFHRALGASHLSTGDWEEARQSLEEARGLTRKGQRIHKEIHLLLALAKLRILDLGQLASEGSRGAREEAMHLLAPAVSKPNPLPEALYARGILYYETDSYEAAARDFDMAARQLRHEAHVDQELFARTRFYLGASLLLANIREEGRRAARLLEETLGKVEPDLESFYPVYDRLKMLDQKVALRSLDAVDLGRGASPENLLLIALEYQGLGEPDRAIQAAERTLQVAMDLDQRIEAMKVLLTAHNMQGKNEEARNDYFQTRDLLLRRGAFEELEKILKDEALVGQALDHIERKCELADLYEEMDNRDWECANLRMSIARALKARKDREDIKQAFAILQEINIQYPELAQEDLENIEKLLQLKGDDDAPQGSEAEMFQRLAVALGHAPRILVVGGNERQRRHHPRLSALAEEWGFEGEWIMANYGSPQRVVQLIEERLRQGIDVLILLHWNRHETTEPALELARNAGVPARTVFYAGFTSLRVCLGEMAARMLQQERELKP